MGWVQLDNQTQEPVAPVVVAPTMVKHPQATLQMSFIRNNVKSHSHLNHFEVRRVTSIVDPSDLLDLLGLLDRLALVVSASSLFLSVQHPFGPFHTSILPPVPCLSFYLLVRWAVAPNTLGALRLMCVVSVSTRRLP